MLTITIPGPPHGQGRPRAVNRGRFAGVYERGEDRSWKAYAAQLYQSAMQGRAPLAGPLQVEIVAIWACPKSARKCDKAMRRPRVGKPDWDNIGKAACDAGNGILWFDDAQIASATVTRYVGAEGEPPLVKLTVYEWGEQF